MPLHPQCAAIIAAAAAGAPFAAPTPAAMRAAYAATTAGYAHASGTLAGVESLICSDPGGDIGLRLYRPAAPDPLPALIFCHGGGWVLGDLDSHDHVCRALAQRADVAVVAVDYRRAPEHRFPAALDDVIAAVRWVAAHGPALGIDPDRLAIGGDSAGGNLAAAAALALRDSGGPRLALQLLIYPAVDCTADNESLRTNGEGYLLTRAALENFYDLYLPARAARSDPRASPQLAADHRGLPRAFIQTAEFDPLRDEGARYADTLRAAGVAVDYRCYPGMVHGFMRMGAKVDLALEALADASRALRAALAG